MLKFVQKWMRSAEETEIVEEGTRDKWTKCEEGLPSTDRKVEVMIYGAASKDRWGDTIGVPGMDITIAQFNPHVGWRMEKTGVVVCWRDIEKEYLDMMKDFSWAKACLGHLVK